MLAADAFAISRKEGVVVCAEPPRVALASGGVLDVECPPNVLGILQVGDRVTVEYVGRRHFITFDDPDSANCRLGEES